MALAHCRITFVGLRFFWGCFVVLGLLVDALLGVVIFSFGCVRLIGCWFCGCLVNSVDFCFSFRLFTCVYVCGLFWGGLLWRLCGLNGLVGMFVWAVWLLWLAA